MPQNETIVVFPAVSKAGNGDGACVVAVPVGDDMVDKLATVIAVKLPQGEGEVRVDVPEGGEGPMVGVVEEGAEANPVRGDIGGG
jgi:hypothetical protein